MPSPGSRFEAATGGTRSKEATEMTFSSVGPPPTGCSVDWVTTRWTVDSVATRAEEGRGATPPIAASARSRGRFERSQREIQPLLAPYRREVDRRLETSDTGSCDLE